MMVAKKVISSLLVFLLMFQGCFSCVFADEPKKNMCEGIPDICGRPSEYFSLYTEFQYEVLNKLRVINMPQMVSPLGLTQPGLFSSQTLKLPGTGNFSQSLSQSLISHILGSTLGGLSQTVNASVSILAILALTAGSVYGDNLQGLGILFQDRAIVRDRKTLLDIDAYLSDIAYEIGMRGTINKPLSDVSAMEEVFQKFQDRGLFFSFNLDKGISYRDIFLLLSNMNAAMKSFISFRRGSYSVLSSFTSESSKVTVSFPKESLELMDEEYSCVRGFSPCNSFAQQLDANFSNAMTPLTSSWKSSIETVKQASQLLAQAFMKTVGATTNVVKKKPSPGEEFLTEREIYLLRTVYGIDTTRLTQQQGLGLMDIIRIDQGSSTIWTATKKAGTSLADAAAGTAEGVASFAKKAFTSTKSYLSSKKKDKNTDDSQEKKDEEFLEAIMISMKEEDFAKVIDSSFNDLAQSQYQVTESWVVTDTTSTPQWFTAIVAAVQDVEDVVGNRDSGVIQSVGNVCEYQCGNKGNTGCFPKSS